MKESVRLAAKTYIINSNNIQGTFLTITHLLFLSRTCEAPAVAEVHGLHAFGEYDLVDGTCGREGDEKRNKLRNEGRRAAGRFLSEIYAQ